MDKTGDFLRLAVIGKVSALSLRKAEREVKDKKKRLQEGDDWNKLLPLYKLFMLLYAPQQ